MRSKLGCFIFFIIMMTSQIFAGTVYYVDATGGNDLNDGLSEVSAWKTIAKVNDQSFFAGDSILFKRGEIWREQLTVPSSGSSGNPITFTSYGSGADPIINGADLIAPGSSWADEGGDIWSATLTTEPSQVFFDGTRGIKDLSPDAEYDWYWDSNVLYVYSTTDPDTAYTSPGIEASSRDYCIYINDNKNYITVDGIEIRYSNNRGVMINTTSIYVTIQNCNIYYTFNSAVYINYYSTYSTCDNLYIYKCGYNGKENNLQGENIWISDDSDYFVIKNCEIDIPHAAAINTARANNGLVENTYIHDMDSNVGNSYAQGIYFMSGDDNVARYNIVKSCNVGFSVNAESEGETASDNDFYYNIIDNCDLGLDIACNQSEKDLSNINVYNNVFYRDNSTQFNWDIKFDYVDGFNFKNNIIINTETSSDSVFLSWGDTTSNVTLDYNCWYHVEARYHFNCGIAGYFSSFAAYQSGGSQDANSMTSDPLFTDAANADFSLQIGSPCIDAGIYVGLTQDYAGNTVPYGWGVDIGAYEYTGVSPLDAEINASPISGWIPQTVNFTGNATGGTPPYSYSWNFGDGTSSSEHNPSHTYNDPGDYTATLTVTDSQSNQDSDSIIINAYAPTTPLKASFIASPTSGEVPLTVNFTGSATGGVLPYSYSWDFRDGTSSSEQNPIHTYSEAGDYTVSLTVTDSQSNQDSDSLTINASTASIPPYLSCSPASLYFGSTTPGNESSDQYLRIINAGGGLLTWNIEDDAAWLSCSPSSGTDRGEITVSVNTSGLSQGLYMATIIVSSPEAYNSPQYVSVNLRVYESEEESSPFGSLDTRLNGSTVSGSVPITGWALDDIETMGVEIKRNSDPEDPPEAIGPDGLVYLGDAVFVEGSRPDVEKSYPEYPLNSRAGWGYMLLTNSLPNRGNGFFTIYAFAYDAGGNRVEIGRKTIFCDNTNSVKPFGTVDTPEEGESIGGSDYINFGWTLTPLPKTIPKDGSTILLWVDGVQVGEPVYNQYREDIATLYPEYNNAQGAVGYYYLDTTQYENGVHTITWSVMDDGGEVDGIGARYFSIDNIETGNVNQERFELKRIYQEDVEGRLIIDMKEFRIGYKPQDDNNIILHLKRESRKGYRLQVEEMEPLRIVLEGSSGGNMNYIGWGESDWRALPIGSTFDPEQGIFSWIPTPGFIGKYRLYFAVTDGSYMSKPLQILVNVMPKSYN